MAGHKRSGAGRPTGELGVSSPPPKRARLLVWIALLGCLVAACPPLLVDIHRSDAVVPDESGTLATSIETWRRSRSDVRFAGQSNGAGLTDLSLVAYLNARRQLADPPGVTWLHLLAFSWQEPTGDLPVTEQLILRARLTSVVFALLTVAAVFWAGHSIGHLTTAVMAALVCAANPIFIFYGRLATAAVPHAGLTILSIAAALWAIRPLRPAPSVARQFIGWVVCGLALGAAMLTGGAWTVIHVTAPVLIMLVLCPDRLSHLLGLLAAILIGVLLTVPWLVYANDRDPQAYQHWLASLRPENWTDFQLLGKQGGERVGLLLLAMLPWTLWVIGAVVQPFSTSSSGSRRRMMLGWVWLATSLLVVIFEPRHVRLSDELLILPVVANVIGQLIHQYADLAGQGRYARFWRMLRWPHLAMLVVASAGVGVAWYIQPMLVKRQLLDVPLAWAPPWYFAVTAMLLLLVLVFVSMRWTLRQYPAAVVGCWALWTLALMTVLAMSLSRGPVLESATRRDALKLVQATRSQPVYFYPRHDRPQQQADPALLLYANRTIPTISAEQIDQLKEKHLSFVILSAASGVAPSEGASLIEALDALDMTLWQYPGADRLVQPN